jgi:hypothetical protein
MTTNSVVRVQEAADRGKGWEAEVHQSGELVLYRQVTTSPTEAMRMEDTGTGTLYIGKAPPGTSESSSGWLIKKILTSGGNISILYPSGNGGYEHVWADRAGYNYL